MPSLLKRIPLSVKLPAIIVLLSLLAVGAVGYVGYSESRAAMMRAAEDRLDAAVESRAESLTSVFKGLNVGIAGRVADPVIYRALTDLEAGFEALKAEGDPMAILRKEYVTDNRFKPAERYKLDQGASSSSYNIAHGRFHPGLVSLVAAGSYYDVFLIAQDGDIVYSTMKEADFASNLKTGEWKGTALARVAMKALEATEPSAAVLSDMERYAPSAGAPAAFAAAPVFGPDGRLVGAFAVRIPPQIIDSRMQRRAGLGETGLSFLVGADGYLRSNSRADGQSDLLSRSIELPADAAPDDRISWIGEGIGGQAVLRVAEPFSYDALTYTIVAEQSLDEILTPIRSLRNRIIQDALIALAVIGGAGILMGRAVARPIRAAARAVAEIGRRNYTTEIAGLGRRDELGEMARSLSEVRATLAAGEAAARESAFKGSAFEGASAVLMMVDRDYKIAFANPAARAFLARFEPEIRKLSPGFTADQIIGMSIDVFHANPDRNRRLLSGPGNLPLRTEIKLGEALIALDIGEVTLAGEGAIGLVTEWKDVTEDRQNRAILESLDRSQVMMLFDAEGRTLRVNGNLKSATGAAEEAVVGRACADFVVPLGDTPALSALWDRLRRGESAFGRFRVAPAGGRAAILDGGFGPIPDRNGKLMRVSFLGNNVTAAEESIRQASETRELLEVAQRRVVDRLRVALSALAEGDLTSRIDDAFDADYETLRADFNAAVERLSQAIAAVVDNAQSIRGEVKEISNAASDLSRRTEKQAATLEQTAAALDQLTSSVKSAAEGAAEANRVVADARQSAEASGTVVQQTVSAMAEISSSSERISKIISVIDDIAFQTNLLALNAGVEAARAGEAGRGFAVVASEVRALAQRSSDAAREINDLIAASSIQVRKGVALVGQAGDALKGIVSSVGNIAARVSEIAASAREQSVGLAEINSAVNQLDQVTQQNAAMFEETSAASHALAREAEALTETTGRFRVPEASDRGAVRPAERVAPSSRRHSAQPAPRRAQLTAAASAAPALMDEDWHEF
ncbi:MAG: methyl-accepting chemotaxis protein [Pseudomonadota bacterium]